ncbi:hydantoin utilization protein A [Algicella marina]|uniref:Hydantoin utilization protein A n=2 Tax=Algicella marina TaxID=2683284 RepID=A0A6P1T5R7_9RHOB|nr:hydantoin utilization protein A [Algicella marina]
MTNLKIRAAGLSAFATLAATPVFAHHPLGGAPMETLAHGLLSGVGHPLLGFDHLFFVALVGIVAAVTGRGALGALAYIGAMLLGTLLMSFGVGLPVKEVVIALSLLVVGGIALSGRGLSPSAAMALFAGFGLFHGSAFGDTIAAQEAAMGAQVLVGYLIGLGVVQYAIALAAGWVATKVWKAESAQALQPRLAGAVVAGAGLLLVLEAAEGAVFGLLGLGA